MRFPIDEYIQSTHEVFVECPRMRGLKLVSVEVTDGFLRARFEGPPGDFRGPYGVMVRLPETQQDEQWVRLAGGEQTVRDWVHAGVALRAVRAHAAAQNHARGYRYDDTWWLFNDRADDMP
jgi:hypothetical protein